MVGETKKAKVSMNRSGSFMVEEAKVSMKLMASLATAWAEIEDGVVAKADQ